MTVNEPSTLVICNVRWHLATGAQAVHVYLDDPEDPVADALRAVSGCHVTLCDDVYWAGHRGARGRPASQMRRQSINANVAKDVSGSDWLFHIDADEFIWQDNPLSDELAQVKSANTEVNLTVLERLFPQGGAKSTLFEGAFRVTADLTEGNQAAAYGPFAAMMKRGQYSHGAGKGGVRTSDRLRLGVHNATQLRDDTWRRAARHVARSARLLHFDGLTPLHWLAKVLRYRRNPAEVQNVILQAHRAAQMDWMSTRCASVKEAEAAHHALFALTPDRRARLSAFDLLCDVPFDPGAVLGTDAPDLTPAAFDADLMARTPWLRDTLGGV